MAAPERIKPNAEERRAFLEAIHGEAVGLIDVRAIFADGPVKRLEALTPAAALDAIAKHADRANVYFGVATRAQPASAFGDLAGGKGNLREVAALWIDLDCGTKAESVVAARAALGAFPMPPSVMVWSGGGFHAYWLLEEPADLTQPEAVQRFEDVLRGMADVLGGDLAATDASRVLRVVATTNYPDARKRAKGREPAPCVVEQADNGARYPLDDFELFRRRGAALRNHHTAPLGYEDGAEAWDGELPAEVAALLEAKGPNGNPRWPALLKRWTGDATGLRDESDSGLDLAVANEVANALAIERSADLEGDGQRNALGRAIDHALRYRRKEARARAKHAGYYRATVGKALAEAKRRAEERAEQESTRREAEAAKGREQVSTPEASTPNGASELEDATDDGNARRLVRLHGRDLIYVPTWKRWMVWDEKRFRDDPDDVRARKAAKRAAYEPLKRAEKARGDKQRDELVKLSKQARSAQRIKAALWMAAPDLAATPDELDAEPALLNVRNGTVELETGKLRPHSRDDRITRLAPVNYDAEAACPLWLEFLEQVQPDAEMRDYLQRIAGTALYGLAPEVPMLIHLGNGANGKSVFLETRRGVLGDDYSAELASQTLTARAGGDHMERLLVPAAGKRMLTALELSEGQRLNEQAVKRLVSGEPVRVRFLYGESFEITPVGTLELTSNHALEVGGDDHGIWRRIREVPWSVQIPEAEQNKRLRAELLREEAPGILRWMVKGFQRWRADGLHEPEAIRAATETYREEQDHVAAFLEECANVGTALFVAVDTLRTAYRAWAERNGHTPLNETAFGRRLKRRGFEAGKLSGGKRIRRGLGLKPDHDPQRTGGEWV